MKVVSLTEKLVCPICYKRLDRGDRGVVNKSGIEYCSEECAEKEPHTDIIVDGEDTLADCCRLLSLHIGVLHTSFMEVAVRINAICPRRSVEYDYAESIRRLLREAESDAELLGCSKRLNETLMKEDECN